jgi:hypothetical protein
MRYDIICIELQFFRLNETPAGQGLYHSEYKLIFKMKLLMQYTFYKKISIIDHFGASVNLKKKFSEIASCSLKSCFQGPLTN